MAALEYDIHVDEDLVDIFPGFWERVKTNLERLPQLIKDNQFNEIQRIAHDWKGTGLTYGSAPISDIGKAMELAAKANDMSAIAEYHKNLDLYFQKANIIYPNS